MRRIGSRRRRAAAALSAAALLSTACSGTPGPAPPVPSPATTETPSETSATLRVAIDRPDDAIPSTADESAELWLADAMFDALTRVDAEGAAQPSAAVSWSAGEDMRTWTFLLRDGARWHDGSAVTAADVVRGWQRVVRAGRMAHLLARVDGVRMDAPAASSLAGVRALDARTLQVRLREPDAEFPLVAAHPALAPLPPAADRLDYGEQPIGNGPFAAAEALSTARFARLVRFPQWANGPQPRLDEIVFQIMDAETAYVAQQQGRIHVAPIPPGAMRRALSRHGGTVWRAPRAALYLLGMDHRRPPFDRAAVRRAVALAVDRQRLVDQVSEGNAALPPSLLPEGFPAAVQEACQVCTHDPQAARAAFSDAGVAVLTLSFNTGAGHEEVARRLRADFAAAGVELRLDPREPAEFFAAAAAGQLSLFRLGAQPDTWSADALLRPLLHSDAIPRGGGGEGVALNYGGYRSTRVDQLLDQARQEHSPMIRAARHRQAARIALQQDVALSVLFAYRHRLAVAEQVQGFRPDPLGGVDWAGVWLQGGRVPAGG